MATPKKAATPAPKKAAEKKVIDTTPEGKAKRFAVIAGRRTKKLLTGLQNLGNCSNANVYGYTDEQVEKIFNALQNQLNESKKKFTAVKEKKAKVDFSL